MVLFSASISRRVWPSVTDWPAGVLISRTSPPSRFSPNSGSFTSMGMQSPSKTRSRARTEVLSPERVRFLRIDVELLDRLLQTGRFQLTAGGKLIESRDGDALGIHLEETPQGSSVFTATETIGPQREKTTGHPAADGIGKEFHVVADGDEDALLGTQDSFQIAAPGLRARMEHVPALRFQSVLAQLLVTR